jgi:hypothetical protein
LECFFSQAIAIPFLLLWPWAISRLVLNPGFVSAGSAGALLAIISAVYTELVIILLVIAIVAIVLTYLFASKVLVPRQLRRHSPPISSKSMVGAFLLISILIAILANVGFFKSAFNIISRTTSSNVLSGLYPWAFSPEGIVRLWIGHQQEISSFGTSLTVVFVGLSILTVALGIRFLLSAAIGRYGHLAIPVGVLSLIPAAPLILSLTTDSKFPYQFYKLLLTVWPLIVSLAIAGYLSKYVTADSLRKPSFSVAFFIFGLVLSTGNTALASSRKEVIASSGRGGAHLLIGEEFRNMRELLKQWVGRDVYLWWHEPKELYAGNWRARWLAYHARESRVWNMNPTPPSGAGVSPLEALPTSKVDFPVLGVSPANLPSVANERIGKVDPVLTSFRVYRLADEVQIRQVDLASRGIITRSMWARISNEIKDNIWYPLWVAGRQDFATLISINFGKDWVRVRYDQWGHPAPIMQMGPNCNGKELHLTIRIHQADRNISVICNGDPITAEIPDVPPYLNLTNVLGVNGVTSSLEGKYPLAPLFPGVVIERPLDSYIPN